MSRPPGTEPLRRVCWTGWRTLTPVLRRMSTAHYIFLCGSPSRRRTERGCSHTVTRKDSRDAATVAVVPSRAVDVSVREFSVAPGKENASSLHRRRFVMKDGSAVFHCSPPVTETAVAGRVYLHGITGTFRRILYIPSSGSVHSRGFSGKAYLTRALLVYRTSDVPSSALSNSIRARQPPGGSPTVVQEVKKIRSVYGAQRASDRSLNFAVSRHTPFPPRSPAGLHVSHVSPMFLLAGVGDGVAGLEYFTNKLMDEREKFVLTGARRTRKREPSTTFMSTTVENGASTVDSASSLFPPVFPLPSHGYSDCATSSCRTVLPADESVLLWVDENGYVPGKRADLPSGSCDVRGRGAGFVVNTLLVSSPYTRQRREVLRHWIPARFNELSLYPDAAEKTDFCRTAEGLVSLPSNFNGEPASQTRSRCPVELSAQECSLSCSAERYVSVPERQTSFPVESCDRVHPSEGFSTTALGKQDFNESSEAAYVGGKKKVRYRRKIHCFLLLRRSSSPQRRATFTASGELSVRPVDDLSAFSEGHFPEPSRIVAPLPTTPCRSHALRFLYTNALPSVSPFSLRNREDRVLTEIRVNIFPDAAEKMNDTDRALDRLVTRVLRHSKHRHHPRHMLHIHHNKHRYRQWFQKPCKTSTGIHLGSKKSGKR